MTLVAGERERLDRFLARLLPKHSRTKLVRLIDAGEVRVDGQLQKPSFNLEPGMTVELGEPAETAPHDLSPADIPLHLMYEDDYLLVVNKPRGLATHPAASLKEPSLVNALLGRAQPLSTGSADYRPGIVHRLDKETTGLLVVAKTDAAHASLAKQIEGKTAERRYVAVVTGTPEHERMAIQLPLGRDKVHREKITVDPKGRAALTHVKVVRRLDAGTMIAARLETGRTHQIRVHLQGIGHPVLGDRLYAPKNLHDWPLQLHAAYLAFDHPASGERKAFFVQPDDSFIGWEFVSEDVLEPF